MLVIARLTYVKDIEILMQLLVKACDPVLGNGDRKGKDLESKMGCECPYLFISICRILDLQWGLDVLSNTLRGIR